MTVEMGTTAGFTYTTYIRATPEQAWRALTDPAVTSRYWRHHRAGPKVIGSDWEKGSTWTLEHPAIGLVVTDSEQVILESDRYSRLAYTWHTFTLPWANAVGMDEDTLDAWRSEPRSKVAFDFDDVGHGVTELSVTHDGFEAGSDVLIAISQGWPAVLSSLKTLLETGNSLATS
jgi:uncharacterized protein YndB with AHSA1/START domain